MQKDYSDLQGKTILVIDDVQINSDIIMALLEGFGLNFLCAYGGKEAVEVFQKEKDTIDLILMDINMPEVDGVTATKEIRQIPDGGAQVPIIAVTANVLPKQIEEYLQSGMNDHIGKPVDQKELIRVMKRYM